MAQLGRHLASNLQNGYLQGVNYVVNQSLNMGLHGCKILDQYDLQTWSVRSSIPKSDTQYAEN